MSETRPHPYDVAFRQVASGLFESVRSDTSEDLDLIAFARRTDVTDLLDRLTPADSDAVDPTIQGGMAHLLYVAFRYQGDGEQTTEVPREFVERALCGPPIDPPPFPTDAVYLQLPRQLFWGRIDEDAVHEPIDGVFVAPAADTVLFAAILGLHPGRTGFSQITAEADGIAWNQCREHIRSPRLDAIMDGGDQAGFRSVVSEAELLYLVQLALQSARQ